MYPHQATPHSLVIEPQDVWTPQHSDQYAHGKAYIHTPQRTQGAHHLVVGRAARRSMPIFPERTAFAAPSNAFAVFFPKASNADPASSTRSGETSPICAANDAHANGTHRMPPFPQSPLPAPRTDPFPARKRHHQRLRPAPGPLNATGRTPAQSAGPYLRSSSSKRSFIPNPPP